MPWIPRGLRDGIVTTRYPRRPDDYGPGFRGAITVEEGRHADPEPGALEAICPTGAISVSEGGPRLDRGRCILCGRCSQLHPDLFRSDAGLEHSALERGHLIVPTLDEDTAELQAMRRQLAERTRALRRSIHIRHVDAGSDGTEEWEIAALTNPIYDVQRLGIFFTASPRHADVLLVTGVGSAGMLGPLRQTFEAMPDPKVVIAVGTDAVSGGLLSESDMTTGGIAATVPVDIWLAGSPPSPFGIINALLVAVGKLDPTPARPAAPSTSTTGSRGGRRSR